MGGITLFLKTFFRRITNDFRHKELLPLKLLFFVHSSTVFVLYPYLTIHMRELGISVEETAIMSAVTPVVSIIMPPLAGMVADRIGNFRVLMAIFSSLGGAASLLLLIVPVGRMIMPYPEHVVMELGCGGPGSNLHLTMSQEHPCARLPALLQPTGKQVESQYEACGFLCEEGEEGDAVWPPREQDTVLQAHSYHVTLSSGNLTDTYSYTLSPEERRGLSHYRTSIRRLAPGRLFFPTTGLYNLSCVEGGCSLGISAGGRDEQGQSTIPSHNKLFRAQLLPRAGGGFVASALSRWSDNTSSAAATLNASCTDIFSQEEQSVLVSVPLNGSGDSLTLSSCSPRCLVAAPRNQLCSDLKREVEFDATLTFWAYLSVRVLIGMIGSTAFAMFEGAVIAVLREHKADYGLQRIYATIGGMISSPLSGLLIDYASRGKGYTDFRPAFYLYAGLKIASGVLMLTFNLKFKAPAKNVVSDVLAVLRNVELVALLVVIFILGSAWGYIESFLFWLLQDLGGSRSLMGVTITVGGIAGIPLLVLSGPIIDRIGHANVLFIGFLFYAVRLLGYSLIYNPWLCLVFEAMESVTSSLSFTAAVTYAAKLSTTTTDSSIQGMVGGLYFGVGKGAGSLVGGYLMKWIGTRPTYQCFSVMCAVVGCVYFLFNKFYLRKRPQVEGNDIVKKKSKFMDAGDVVEIDLTGAHKEKKSKKKHKLAAGVETLPINTGASKNYASDKITLNDNQSNNKITDSVLENNTKNLEASKKIAADDKPVEACNINLAYDECDDDYESIDDNKPDEKCYDNSKNESKSYDNPNLEIEDENPGNQCESTVGNGNETKECETKNAKDDKNEKNLSKSGSVDV